MSSLAQHLLKLGCVVSGSDRQENEQTQKLRKLGAVVHSHSAENVKDAQLVVYSSAIPHDNVELVYAREHNVPTILREQLLGEIFDGFDTRIAVCGTHGKTTVTAMLHHVLQKCGISHSAFIGGEYHGSNYFFGKKVAVAEACEYNRSFLYLHPTICLCLNVEYDHPDCYKSQKDVEQAFGQLFEQSERVILPSSQKSLCERATVFDEVFSAQKGTLVNGCAQFDVLCENEFIGRCRLRVCGKHNVKNALAVLTVAHLLNLPLLQVLQALGTFDGVDRRWTKEPCSLNVVCDYAHHPTEIESTVRVAKSICKGRIIAVFQPHTFTRTRAFFKRFVSCFNGVSEIIYLPIFPAREKPIKHVTSFQLYKLAKAQNKNAKYFPDFQRVAKYLKRTATPDDLILLVGAGDIVNLSKFL